MRTEQRIFAQSLNFVLFCCCFKRNVIPERISFLPGLSVPTDLPQPRCLPFPNAPPLATFIKKKKKEKWHSPSPLAFPSKAWKLEEIQIKLVAY